jgi:xanthine dehydrogenase accessory factor
MNLIAETAGRLLDDHQPFVLATIVNREGSAPRTAGTRMIVAAGGRAVGTIGGGLLEARTIAAAAEVLAARRPLLIPFDMTQSELAAMDMICGGRLEVLLEFIDPGSPTGVVFKGWGDVQRSQDHCLLMTVIRFAGEKVAAVSHGLLKNDHVVYGNLPFGAATIESLARNYSGSVRMQTVALGESLVLIDPVLPQETVFLFGAGHVAQPTARLAAIAGFRVRVVDDRADFANAERFPEAEEVRVVTDFDSASNGLAIDRGAFVVILTRGHLHDKTVLMQALRTEAAYIGMIGSRRKRDHIFNALLKQGFTQADLERVHSPIGIDIGAETPEEIALSIVAELVHVRARRRRS